MARKSETVRLAEGEQTLPLSDAAGTIEVPKQIGSVRLERELGQGGMGVVWRGRDEVLDRSVAVKFLLCTRARKDDPDFEGFLNGARAAAAVRHPGLTAIHQADLVNGVPFLVMEFVDGPNLGDVLRRTGPLDPALAARVMAEISHIIAALHDREIVHRDIKPENVLLSPSGELIVTDFGLACDRVPQTASREIKTLAGTPHYMAPELFRGNISMRSDVYALGIMAYELLTGEMPYHGTLDEMRHAHERGELPQQPLGDRNVPESIVYLLQRLTHPNRMYRAKTAHQAARDFDRIAEQLETGTSPPPGRLLLERWRMGGKLDEQDNSSTEARSSYAALAHAAQQKRGKSGDDRTEAHATDVPPIPHRDDVLGISVECLGCGYNLAGSSPRGRCPECGESAEFSVSPGRLIFADLKWLKRVRRCYGLLGLSLAMPFLILLLGIPLTIVSETVDSAVITGAIVVVLIMFGAAYVFVPILTIWQITGEPNSHRRWRSWRLALTTAYVICLIFVGYTIIAEFIGWRLLMPLPAAASFSLITAHIFIALLGVVVLTASIMGRVPRPSLCNGAILIASLGCAIVAAQLITLMHGVLSSAFDIAAADSAPAAFLANELTAVFVMAGTLLASLIGTVLFLNAVIDAPITTPRNPWRHRFSRRLITASTVLAIGAVCLGIVLLWLQFAAGGLDAGPLYAALIGGTHILFLVVYLAVMRIAFSAHSAIKMVVRQIEAMPEGARERAIALIESHPTAHGASAMSPAAPGRIGPDE